MEYVAYGMIMLGLVLMGQTIRSYFSTKPRGIELGYHWYTGMLATASISFAVLVIRGDLVWLKQVC